MAARHILTPAQRTQLFDPPDDEEAIARLYTLGSDDLAEVFRRRRPANRLGFATQLCLLRHPGRALRPEELPPSEMLAAARAGGRKLGRHSVNGRNPTN